MYRSIARTSLAVVSLALSVVPCSAGELLKTSLPTEVPGASVLPASALSVPMIVPLPVSEALFAIATVLENVCVPPCN